MPKSLAERQLAKTRAEMERALKMRDKKRLAELREALRAARKARTARLRAVTRDCKAARRRNAERAKRARERLRESIQRTRDQARQLCASARGSARTETLRAIDSAVGALEAERARQRQLAAWTRPRAAGAAPSRRERAQESDDVVAANIDEPGLRIVWEAVKGKVRGSGRRSRTEAFYEWVHDHPARVYEIQEADAERAIAELEAEERKLSRELKKAGRYTRKSADELRALLADVPF